MLGMTSALFSGFIESTNDMLYLLLGFHESFLGSVQVAAFYFLTVGIVLFIIAMVTGMMKVSDFHQYIGAMALVYIALIPVKIDEFTYRTTAFENESNRNGTLSYTVALGPHLVWSTVTNIVLFFQGSTNKAISDQGGNPTDRNISSENVRQNNFYAYAQALQIANSDNAYLLQSTPLARNLIEYNKQCNAAIQYNRQLENSVNVDDSEWLALGLGAGGMFLFYNAVHQEGLEQSWAESANYSGSDLGRFAAGATDIEGNMERVNNYLLTGVFGIIFDKATEKDVSIYQPSHAVLSALEYPPVQQADFSSGLLVPNKKYWQGLASKWALDLAEDSDAIYSRIAEANSRQNVDPAKVLDGTINHEYLMQVYDQRYLRSDLATVNANNVGEYFKYYPGNCREFYEVMLLSWKNFAHGVLEYMNYLPDNSLDKKIVSTAIVSAVQSIQSDAQSQAARAESGFDLLGSDNGDTGAGANLAETGLSWLTGIASAIDSLMQAFTIYVMGPKLISQLSVAAALIYIISPVILTLQLLMPGRPSLVKTLAVTLSMIFFFVALISFSTAILHLITEMLLTQSAIATDETLFYPADMDHFQSGDFKKPLDSLDRFLVGIDSLAVMLFAMSTYLTYAIFLGDDQISRNKPASSHVGKVASGIIGGMAYAASKALRVPSMPDMGSSGKNPSGPKDPGEGPSFGLGLPAPNVPRIGDGPTGGTSSGSFGKRPPSTPSGSAMDSKSDSSFEQDLSNRFKNGF